MSENVFKRIKRAVKYIINGDLDLFSFEFECEFQTHKSRGFQHIIIKPNTLIIDGVAIVDKK